MLNYLIIIIYIKYYYWLLLLLIIIIIDYYNNMINISNIPTVTGLSFATLNLNPFLSPTPLDLIIILNISINWNYHYYIKNCIIILKTYIATFVFDIIILIII